MDDCEHILNVRKSVTKLIVNVLKNHEIANQNSFNQELVFFASSVIFYFNFGIIHCNQRRAGRFYSSHH